MSSFRIKLLPAAFLSLAVLGMGGAQAADTAGTTAADSASAQSQSAEAGAKRQGHHAKKGKMRGKFHKHHGQRRMSDLGMWIPGYGPVSKDAVETLALNDKQNALLNEAREASHASRDAASKRKPAPHDTSSAEKRDMDPHAAVKAQQQRAQQRLQQQGDITQKWLAVWDSLDEKQQQQLAAHVAEKKEKRQMRRQGKGDHKTAADAKS